MQVECLHSISSWIEAFDYMLLCYHEVSGQDISDNGWRKRHRRRRALAFLKYPAVTFVNTEKADWPGGTYLVTRLSSAAR